MDKPLILFDGVCNLCNGSVQFVINHDPEGYFRFASLQSEKGQAILKELGMKTDNFDTFIYIENGKAYTKSTGVLNVIKHFKNFYRFFFFLTILPAPIRDFFYTFVARNRYHFFGKKEQCMIPTPELKARFLS